MGEYAVLSVLAARWLLLACGLRGRGWHCGSVAMASAPTLSACAASSCEWARRRLPTCTITRNRPVAASHQRAARHLRSSTVSEYPSPVEPQMKAPATLWATRWRA